MSAVLMFIGLIFCVYGVHEGPRPVGPTTEAVTEKPEKAKEKEAENVKEKKVNLLMDFFNFRDLRTIFKVFTRKRTEKKRTMLFLCYILLFFGFGPMFGKFHEKQKKKKDRAFRFDT